MPLPVPSRTILPSSAALTLLALTLPEARGQNEPVPAPPGYPTDLVVVPKGDVYLGIDAKKLLQTAKLYARGRERALAIARRIQARELGKERLTIPTFYIGRHEVTNEQFAAYVKAVWPKARFPFDWWPEEEQNKVREEYYKKNKGKGVPPFKPLEYWSNHYKDLKWEIPKGMEKGPVRYVSFDEAQGYCRWAGLRLPFEPEWQRALMGDSKSRYLWGEKWDPKNYLAKLRYERMSKRRCREVCAAPEARSVFGLDDMIGNVWEWTQTTSAPFASFREEFNKVNKLLRKAKEDPLFEPDFDGSRYICRGGSFITASQQAQLAFTTTARFAVSGFQTTEALGFRVAKTVEPGFDTSLLWYRTRFVNKNLGTASLSLPNTSELRKIAKGEELPFEQRAVERWDLDGEIIRAYHMVSFIPLRELNVTKERSFISDSAVMSSGERQGIPIAAVFTTENLRLKQTDRTGKTTWTDIPPDMYTVSYRGPGLPRELEIALGAGAKHFRSFKLRPSQMKKSDLEKSSKKKKKAKKKKKKSKRQLRNQADLLALKNWEEICDRYGMSDDDIKAFGRRTKPKDILIRAGDLRIPVDRAILLFRKHDGDYIGWQPYQKAVSRTNASRSAPRIEILADQDMLVYHGGPRIKPSSYRLQFQIPVYLAKGELQKKWITHELAYSAGKEKKTETRRRIHPKPRRKE